MSSATLTIKCGPVENNGKRAVVATLGSLKHRDKFDVDDSFKRSKFRDQVIVKFQLDDGAHEFLESRILAAAEDTDSSGPPAVANVVNMADVESKSVKWFWEPYVPAAAITDLCGDPNEGKSTIAVDIIARYSRGGAMPPHTAPDGTFAIGNSLLIAGEDDPERTVKPRLMAAGADVSRVHLLQTVTVCDETRHVQLPLDLPLIEGLITEHKIGLVVLDVLSAFMERGTSMNDDAAMRRLFNPMAAMAQRTQAAILTLRHMNKKEGTRSMYRAGGSIAIIGAARAGFAVAPHPDDEALRVFVPIKHNLGPRPHSLTYSIEANGDASRIAWGGHVELTANDALSPQQSKSGKVDVAKGIIADVLASGSRGENEVKSACEEAGVSSSTYWRARKSLGVLSERTGFGSHGEWLLSLPSTNGAHHDEF